MLDDGQLLLQIQNAGGLFSGYELCLENGEPVLLGSGGQSKVYEVRETERPHRSFALKATFFTAEKRPKRLDETYAIWQNLCHQSEHIIRIIARKVICPKVSDQGELIALEDKISERSSEVELLLMEKLIPIIDTDRFHRISVFHDRLKQIDEIITLFEQIGQAVSLIHKTYSLHRDIKLENIFYDTVHNCYKLGDFGAARRLVIDQASTVIYSDGYGAPEIKGMMEEVYSAKADIYSLGVSVYLLLNDLKFPASEGYIYNPRQYEAGFVFPPIQKVPGKLNRILQKMCAYNPGYRYESMEQILSDLSVIKGEIQTEKKEEEQIPEYSDFETQTYKEEKGTTKQDAAQDVSVPLPTRRDFQILFRIVQVFFTILTVVLCIVFGRAQLYQDQMLPIALALTGFGYAAIRRKVKPVLLALIFFALLILNIGVYGFSMIYIILAVSVMAKTYSLCGGVSAGYGLWLLGICVFGR
ncbi:MAG: protein kinase [Lachnospiraceae bacterium]|nr:protein kinase [Lachnospiraceae bacterium]